MSDSILPKPDTRVRELDALRGIAALSVVMFHLINGYFIKVATTSPQPFDFYVGMHGVDLFFAISGFVICMTLNQTRQTSDFLVSRFSRLFPAYWVAIVLTSLTVLAFGPEVLTLSLPDIAVNFTMLQGFFNQPHVDEAYWTLTFELAFYGWMLLVWRLGLLKRIEAFMIGAMILYYFLFDHFNFPRTHFVYILALGGFMHFFVIGVASYRIWSGARRWQQQMPVLFVAFMIAVLSERGAARPQEEIAIFTVLVIAIMIAVAYGRLVWLRHPVLLWLGAISYPLYLVHQNIGYSIMAQLEARGVPFGAAMLVALGGAVVLATAINRLVEMPALRAIRSAWRGRLQKAQARRFAA
jgi:peptidoglycan/LPS O-acetylase OafA/YrhL